MNISNILAYNYITDADIHEFIFTESTRKAMDDYIGWIYANYDEHLKGRSVIRVILDISQSGMLPVRYASAVTEKTIKELAPFPKPYIAYLSDGVMEGSLINSMDYTTSKRIDRLLFRTGDRPQAIEWLSSKTTP